MKHLRLPSALTQELDKELHSLRKHSDMIREVHKIMNTIKANGMYSHKERELEESNYDLMQVPPEERRVLRMGWDFRIRESERLAKKLESFILKCEREINEL